MQEEISQPPLPGISKEQARAWMLTVLYPISRTTKIAKDQGTDWSFRSYSQDFEYITPLSEAVPRAFDLNLRHFQRYHPEFSKMIIEYDQKLDSLRESCRRGFGWLIEQPRLKKAALEAGRDVAPYLAEYVINGVAELPSNYTLREVWSSHRSELMELRASPDGATYFETVQAAGDEFCEVVNRVNEAVDTLILDLAIRHELPPIDPDILVD